MEQFIKIALETSSAERSEILMAELSEIDYYAFEENESVLNAYIAREKFDVQRLQNILRKGERYDITIIDNKNWNEEWESGFHPVYVESFAGVRAAFHKPLKGVAHEIIITPRMSFGTGHHATTYLMMEQMANIDFTDKTVIDFGTGTGVLAILAEKMRAKSVIALDNDEWSIQNAKENIKVNTCRRISIKKKDTVKDCQQADIILANINLNVLLAASLDISFTSKKGTLLLVSGFLWEDKQMILNAFNIYGFSNSIIREKENWCSLLLKKE